MAYKEFAVLGDSIANGFYDETGLGWVGRLVQKLNRAVPHGYYHNNFAMDGSRIFDAWHRLCSDVIPRRPNILLVAVGINDIIRWGAPAAPCDLSPEMRDEFWTLMLQTAKKNIGTVIVNALTPVNEARMPGDGAFERKYFNLNSDIKAYNRRLEEICRLEGVHFLNAGSGLNVKTHLHDGTHPNAAGHELIADNVCRFQEKGF